jgi:hypothetical protein
MTFRPSVHGFKFPNLFSGIPLPPTLSALLPRVSQIGGRYGLCGGMSAAALDFYLQRDRRIVSTEETPAKGTPLYNYLYDRQIATFGPVGRYIGQFAAWMAMSLNGRNGLRKRTADNLVGPKGITRDLDNGRPVVLGLVFATIRGGGILSRLSPDQGKKLWDNHQVLAYGYSRGPDESATIKVYDPNYPGNSETNDEIVIHCERMQVATRRVHVSGLRFEQRPVYGYKCELRRGATRLKTIRGCFRIDYTPTTPPATLRDPVVRVSRVVVPPLVAR